MTCFHLFGCARCLLLLGSMYVQFFCHASVKYLLRLPALSQILVFVIQACPVLCKFLVTAPFYLLEKLLGAVGYFFPFFQAFSWVFRIYPAHHEGVVFSPAVASIVMCSTHQHC